jgi:protein TonB
LRRRASSFALALAINLGLLLVLMTLGIIPAPEGQKALRGIVVDLTSDSRSASQSESTKAVAHRHRVEANRPVPKPPVVLPVKPTIAVSSKSSTKSQSWIEMSSEDMAASDISKLPSGGSGGAADSEVAGHGPNGETLYAADWAREPTDAELGGYLPHNPQDGWGEIACKTIPGNRVDDCIEIGQSPRGSHLASAVRQAAWQFRVKPPRKNGRPMIGEWILIHIDYSFNRRDSASGQ